MTVDERIAELEAENAALREQLSVVLERVQVLEARLAKDSHNSGKPPSSDRLARKTKSLRRKSGKKPGGQLGHRGETLRLVAVPDEVIEHRPTHCAVCHEALDAEAVVVLRERRQVHEVPPLRLHIHEHHVAHVCCPRCAHVTAGTFPPEAPSRVQYGPRLGALVVYLVEQQLLPDGRVRGLLADLFGAPLSTGTLVHLVQRCAAALAPVEAQVKVALRQAAVLHSDATGVRLSGRLAWAHVASTARLTHYAIHPKRGSEATTAIGILPDFQGGSVHDGWAACRTHAGCRLICHALCNIHHLRELTFFEEQYQQAWAGDLKQVLRDMKATVDHARAIGSICVDPAVRDGFVARYDALLAAGLAAHPPPQRRPRQRGRLKQSPVRNLLERLWLGREQVLAFLDDLTIPFDNNQAERDLRMLKVQQKVSGAFRASSGADAFSRIRGYLSTLSKQGVALLAALETVFVGQPFYPTFA